MGRFSDGGQYTSDIVKGTLSKVNKKKLTKITKKLSKVANKNNKKALQ